MFGLSVPLEIADVDPRLLRPRDTWADAAAYDRKARQLAAMFRENFEKFTGHVSANVLAAGPIAPS